MIILRDSGGEGGGSLLKRVLLKANGQMALGNLTTALFCGSISSETVVGRSVGRA